MVPPARQAGRGRSGLILLLYNRPAFFKDAATITDHIDAFGRFSRFPVIKLNTAGGFPRDLAKQHFDALILHYSLFASGPNAYLLDEGFLNYLAGADDTYKVAFFQDEHEYCVRRFEFLNEYSVDCVYTCFDEADFPATYGKYTNVSRMVNYMPAYVSPDMVEEANRLSRPDERRAIDIGYRSRPTPPYFGRGGMEKVEIGERFAEAAAGSGLQLDISAREEDRLYGDAWYEFLAGSRGQLGTESGVSCVDLEDEVRDEYLRLSSGGREVTLEEMETGALGRWDRVVQLRTTSSRHFEAAAMRVCQVMYEGRYNGVLEADRHFISLRKDFSNFDEVVARFRDPAVRAEITANAHRDLIASGKYGYETFMSSFDSVLADAGLEPSSAASTPPVLRGRPLVPATARYLQGAAIWLERNHPRVSRVVLYLLRPAFFAGRQARKLRNHG